MSLQLSTTTSSTGGKPMRSEVLHPSERHSSRPWVVRDCNERAACWAKKQPSSKIQKGYYHYHNISYLSSPIFPSLNGDNNFKTSLRLKTLNFQPKTRVRIWISTKWSKCNTCIQLLHPVCQEFREKNSYGMSQSKSSTEPRTESFANLTPHAVKPLGSSHQTLSQIGGVIVLLIQLIRDLIRPNVGLLMETHVTQGTRNMQTEKQLLLPVILWSSCPTVQYIPVESCGHLPFILPPTGTNI